MLRLKEAIRLADKAHKETGNRYYVLPNGNKGKLMIVDRANFRKLKQKNYLPRKMYIYDITHYCFYCTPYKDGRGKLSKKDLEAKRELYIKFLIDIENVGKK